MINQKVLYLSPYFWPEEVGSAPYCTEVALYLQSNGHHVDVEAFRPHYPNDFGFSAWKSGARDVEIRNGMMISRVAVQARGEGGGRNRISNDLAYLRHVCRRAFAQHFRGTDVVVAYVPSTLTLYAALAVRMFTGARIVAVVHDIESGLASSLGITKSRFMLGLMRIVEWIGLNRADHVIVLTSGMQDELRKLGCRCPISVVPIWATIAPWCEPSDNLRPVITYSGNFGKKQNLDQILPLLEKIGNTYPLIRVVLRGEGSERARIEGEVARLKIPNVQFLPFAPAESFVASMQSANIHLVPQARNVANYALPSKVISIMSVGRPFICVADQNSPLDDLARDSGAGLCIYPNQEDELFRAIIDLISDKSRQIEMGRKGQNYVRMKMNRNHVLSRYNEIIFNKVS